MNRVAATLAMGQCRIRQAPHLRLEAAVIPPESLLPTCARYVRLVPFSFLILIGHYVTLNP